MVRRLVAKLDKKQIVLLCGFILVAQFALAQAGEANPLCASSGDILRDETGKISRFTSDEMKARATHWIDIDDVMRRVDISATVVLELVVDTKGRVVCLKTLYGHPVIAGHVEKAVRQWRFTPARKNGKAVASVGQMEFTLCNINCGKDGIVTSLL